MKIDIPSDWDIYSEGGLPLGVAEPKGLKRLLPEPGEIGLMWLDRENPVGKNRLVYRLPKGAV